jgi:beta-lactamase superfamily II metal-dependent hydrolase
MSMTIHIFDVEHGACNIIETSNNKLIMIDCGHNSTSNWRPSDWIIQNGLSITNLTIANIDEDHVSDLENIKKYCSPYTLKTNWNLTPEWIEKKKNETGGVAKGVAALLDMMRNEYTGEGITIDYGLIRQRFCHNTNLFKDFNNLSMVNFYFYANTGIIFPGDLEKLAWEEFLKDSNFRDCLRKTNIFIASHHGRKNGYCEEVFNYCKPDIIIISDKAIEHATQMHDDYSKHASGIKYGEILRKVLTTRRDGKIKITVNSNGGYIVYI